MATPFGTAGTVWMLKTCLRHGGFSTFVFNILGEGSVPHAARKRSASGFYHVVPKGMSGQIIFESDSDRSLYIKLLTEAKALHDVAIHAYCLMSNHVHLAVEDPKEHLSDFMKYVHERYGTYFAGKTGRTGGIFRTPFWSEPIETDTYLLCAVRYVHAHPVSHVAQAHFLSA